MLETLPPHPNIVGFKRAWQEGQKLFIQTELCQGDLAKFLVSFSRTEIKLLFLLSKSCIFCHEDSHVSGIMSLLLRENEFTSISLLNRVLLIFQKNLVQTSSINDEIPYLQPDLIPEELCWNVLIDIMQAARHLHLHGVVHLDIKPENVFTGIEDGRFKLGDFGIAFSEFLQRTMIPIPIPPTALTSSTLPAIRLIRCL